MYYKISRLILTPTAGKPNTIGEVFVSNPQIDQEAILGKLFFLGEIESNKPAALKIINFLTDSLTYNYYQNEKISLREKMGTIKISEIFESALAKTNADCENFLKKEKIKINPKNFNLVAGTVHQDNLVFSSVGKVKALLIYIDKNKGEKQPNLEEQTKKIYKITNIDSGGDSGGDKNEAKKIHLNKIFSNVTEGKIPPDGCFVFTNEVLPEYINNKHLTKIITTLPPVSAVEHLKTQLHKINSYITFLGLIIKNSSSPHLQRSIPKMQINVTTNNSLERMNETENETKKYLSPAGIINSERYFGVFKKLFNRFKPSQNKKISTIIRDKMFFTRKHRLDFITRLSYHLKNFFIYLVNILGYIFNLLRHPRTLAKNIQVAAKQSWRILINSIIKSIQWFLKIPTISKILLMAFLISSISFGYSLYHSTNLKEEALQRQNYQELIQLIKQKQNQVESSLLYNNEQKANELLGEIEIIIKQLGEIEGVDKKLIDDFIATNREQIEKISHVVRIENPVEIADFSQLTDRASPKNIFLINNHIIALDPNNKIIYQFDRGDQTAGILREDARNINYGSKLNDDEIALVSNLGVSIVSQDMEIRESDEKISETPHEITAVSSYNRRLYALSSSKNNVFRYTRGYDSRQAWIKEDIDIRDAIDIAIDGYIYLLKNNGDVIRMLSGYSDNFKLASINPVFVNASKLKISGDSEEGYVYILESSKKRLVIFNKQGKFLMQYKIEEFNDLKDFIVLQKEQKIIFLNGNAIYEINAQHF